ncbi:MAG: glycerate kinase [Acutalibacteraceae bacterium]|nr:glycerate kinase [Acutalibacteraceae bacterium]
MKRVVIAPDSFKGTLSSVDVCRTVSTVLRKKYKEIEITEIPVADGGEGTVEAFLYALGGEKIYCTVKSPLGSDITAYYGILPDGTAVIEMAQASGISIEKENNALLASTFGTGELISNALDKGCRKLLIGIGGSATTDGGVGCISALGGRFLNEANESIALCGKGLSALHKIDLSGLDKRLSESEITVLCDVKNPLYGKMGAAYVYAPQKGADEEAVSILDEGLKRLAVVTEKTLGTDYSSYEGAGAAGGLGFGLVAFCGARLMPGIECVLSVASFTEKAQKADLIITGEGKMDSQSLMGKVPFGVARKSGGKKVVAIVGVSDIDLVSANEKGIASIIETNPLHLPFDQIKHKAEEMLAEAAKKIQL